MFNGLGAVVFLVIATVLSGLSKKDDGAQISALVGIGLALLAIANEISEVARQIALLRP